MRKIKVAFLVTAYKDVAQLNVLTGQLLVNPNVSVYIHIDKKAEFKKDDVMENPRLKVIDTRISVDWGDMSQALSIFALFRESMMDVDVDYVSLHSEADLAVRPINEFIDFLSQRHASGYMDANQLPAKDWGHGGGLEKIALKYPKIFRKKVSKNHPIRYIRSIYQIAYEKNIIKGVRLPSDITFFGGSDWFTISRSIIERSLSYIDDNPGYMELNKNSLIGNEIIFATLFNIVKRDESIIMDNNLRYIDWSHDNRKESGAPKTLESSDTPLIEESRKYFARKFSNNHDIEVVNHFLRLTNKDSE